MQRLPRLPGAILAALQQDDAAPRARRSRHVLAQERQAAHGPPVGTHAHLSGVAMHVAALQQDHAAGPAVPHNDPWLGTPRRLSRVRCSELLLEESDQKELSLDALL